jgi:translation elongation factor EF-1beta
MADSDSDSDSSSDDDSFNLSPSDSSSGSDDDSSDSEKEETAEEKAKREEFEEKKRKYDEKTERNKAKEQSNVVLDVKPEDDTTNLDDLIQKIRDTVVCDGLHWGAAEKKPLAYGIFKIRIISTIVNIKVSVDWMQEEIEKLEGVQSTDIVSFMKI